MGTPEKGRALLGQADRVYGDTDFYWFSAAHRWAAAHVAWIEGDAERAAALFDRAAEWLRRCGLTAVECQILPDTVEALFDTGRIADAGSWARRAAEIARLLGTQLADAELRRRGSAGKRAAQSVGELTPREQQIAALARRGQATRQIAERLHLSERTVESHLARIYASSGSPDGRNCAHASAPERTLTVELVTADPEGASPHPCGPVPAGGDWVLDGPPSPEPAALLVEDASR